MSRLIRIVCTVLVLAVSLLSGVEQASASGFPGPVPPACTVNYGPGINCLIQTRLGSFSISPHIVQAGHTVTGTISGSCVIGFGNNDPCPISWAGMEALGTVIGGCGQLNHSCAIHIPSDRSSSVYQAIYVSLQNGQGTGYSSDYLAIAGKDKVIVSGRVTDEESGHAVAGVRVTAHCSNGGSTTTDASGKYSLVVDEGRCSFSVDPPKGEAARPADVTLDLSHDVNNVDFALGTGTLRVQLSPDSTNGSGSGVVQGTVTDLDANGVPVADRKISISPPLVVDDGQPRVLVCDQSSRLVYPVTLHSGSLLGAHFTRITDGSGQVHFTAFVGTTPGDWLVDAEELGVDRLKQAHATLSIGSSGGRPDLPVELSSLLLAAGDDTLANFRQSGVLNALDWLGTLKFGGGPNSGALSGIDYMPIWATDPSGQNNAGVVLFAGTPSVRSAVLSYLDGSTTFPPPDSEAVVIDIANMQELLFGTYLAGQHFTAPPFRLPSLGDWANGTVIQISQADVQAFHNNTHIPIPARGRPHFGFIHPTGAEELLYGLGPYPPYGADAQVGQGFKNCITGPAATTITIHSPLSLLVSGPGGTVAGIAKSGVPVDTIPGAIVRYKGRRVVSVRLPVGSYRAALTGTGKGPATVVVSTGNASGVYSLRVRDGQTGAFKIAGRSTGTLRFGGHTSRPAAGLTLRISGLPRRLRHGRPGTLTLRVRDPFGQAAVGAIVHGPHHATAIVDRRGNAKLPYGRLGRGRITISVTGTGLKTARVTLRIT